MFPPLSMMTPPFREKSKKMLLLKMPVSVVLQQSNNTSDLFEFFFREQARLAFPNYR